MRTINHPLYTQSKTLTTVPQIVPSQSLPNFGPVEGFYISLSVTCVDATDAGVSNPIDCVIQDFKIKDAFGKVAVDAVSTGDLPTILDMISPRGVRVTPPTITGDVDGTVTQSWNAFIPYTIAAGDMPAVLDLTIAPASSLQNASMVTSGTTVTVTLDIRIAYATDGDRPTLRTDIGSPPHKQGSNPIGPYLPGGMSLVGLAFTLAGGDGDFSYLTTTHKGVLLDNQASLTQFQEIDVELMQSGHLSGEFITRYPSFVVDSTSTMELNLSSDSAIRLFSMAVVPQARGAS
jgi:hypothetical protein